MGQTVTTWPLDISCPASCYEPTIAIDAQGRVFVTVANAGSMGVLADGNWSYVDPPPLPPNVPPAGLARGDGTLFMDGQSRLWYLSLVLTGTGIGASAYAFVGLQVARTDDQAQSWAINTFVGPFSASPEPLSQAERPWLAFGEGAVYLTYPHWFASVQAGPAFQGVPDGLMVLRSTDDGQTFSAPVRAARPTDRFAIPGRPVVEPDGALLVPYTGSDGQAASAYVLARSTDGGVSFEHSVVNADAGYRFPALTQDHNGTLWAAWLVAGRVEYSSSEDGVTWSRPMQANEDPSLPAPSPWLASGPTGMALAWSEGDPAHPVLALDRTSTRLEGFFTNGTVYGDFVHFAFAPDGSIWLPTVDVEAQRVFVARWAA